jgi:hypothetical protein
VLRLSTDRRLPDHLQAPTELNALLNISNFPLLLKRFIILFIYSTLVTSLFCLNVLVFLPQSLRQEARSENGSLLDRKMRDILQRT